MYNKNTQKYEGYIYLITNTISNKKYIGQTIQKVSSRWARHKCSKNRSDNLDSYIDRAISKYGEENFQIECIDTISSCCEDDMKILLDDAEIFYIKKYESMYYQNGYNLSTGGQGYGLHRNTYSSTSVDCYDYITLNYISTFNSITSAAEYYGYDASQISKVCKGKRSLCGDKIFRYHNDDLYKFPIRSRAKIPILVKDILNNTEQYYISIADAAIKIGCTPGNISNRLSGKFDNTNPILNRYIVSYT